MAWTDIEVVHDVRGCSLIEVLVATSIVAVTVGGLAQLTALAARANVQAGRTSFAVVVAQQKTEEILAEAGLDLNASPAAALTTNVDGFFDFVDRHGRPTGSSATTPPGSDYLRRWSVQPVSGGETLIVQVRVIDIREATSAGTAALLATGINEVRIVAAKSRKAY
jgi:type II secretory pathway pseudopilin PulG